MSIAVSDDAAVVSHQITKAVGRIRAADMHSWDEDRKVALRADLAALRIRKAIIEATDASRITADDAEALAALLRERVA